MKHTWYLLDEGGERVEVTLTCKMDDVIDVPLSPQYLLDLVGNAQDFNESRSEVRKWVD
jgi:hypothetical protein